MCNVIATVPGATRCQMGEQLHRTRDAKRNGRRAQFDARQAEEPEAYGRHGGSLAKQVRNCNAEDRSAVGPPPAALIVDPGRKSPVVPRSVIAPRLSPDSQVRRGAGSSTRTQRPSLTCRRQPQPGGGMSCLSRLGALGTHRGSSACLSSCCRWGYRANVTPPACTLPVSGPAGRQPHSQPHRETVGDRLVRRRCADRADGSLPTAPQVNTARCAERNAGPCKLQASTSASVEEALRKRLA